MDSPTDAPIPVRRELVKEIGLSHNLKLFNDKFEMTFEGDGWQVALEPLSRAIMSGAYHIPDSNASGDCLQTIKQNAIVISGTDIAVSMKKVQQSGQPLDVQIDVWPASDNGPQLGSGEPQDIFSIVKDSPAKEQAWEVIKAVNDSPSAAKLAATEMDNLLLPMREGTTYQYGGMAFDKFYALKDFEPDSKIPTLEVRMGYGSLVGMISQEFALMKSEGRSLQETMAAIQQKGNELLTAIKAGV